MSKPGSYYLKEAKRHGLRVENGHGSHAKVYGPAGRGMMVVPVHRSLSTGVEHAILKWFKALGILLLFLSSCGVCAALLMY